MLPWRMSAILDLMPGSAHRGVVFIADDDDSLREMVRELLESAGYLVLPARNGLEALARMRGIGGASVAIVDLLMPGMDGRGLIATMRADAQLATIPILVLTGAKDDTVTDVDRIIRKPYQPAHLLDVVAELCQ